MGRGSDPESSSQNGCGSDPEFDVAMGAAEDEINSSGGVSLTQEMDGGPTNGIKD